jgi:signal transduction histidine kinase
VADERGILFFATFRNITDIDYQSNPLFESPMICSDEDRIKQVLLGLQANALKFTQRGKVEISVSIERKDE